MNENGLKACGVCGTAKIFRCQHTLEEEITELRAEITRLESLISVPRETTKEGELGFCDKLQGADMPHHRSKLCLNFRPAPLSAPKESE